MTASCSLFGSNESEQKGGSRSVLQGFEAVLSVPFLTAPEFRQDARAIHEAPRGLLHCLYSVFILTPQISNVCMSQISFY